MGAAFLEGGTEAVPYTKLFGSMGKFGAGLEKLGSEALEEGTYTLLDQVLQNWTLGEHSDYNLRVGNYMDQGMEESEAKFRARLDGVRDVLLNMGTAFGLQKGFGALQKGISWFTGNNTNFQVNQQGTEVEVNGHPWTKAQQSNLRLYENQYHNLNALKTSRSALPDGSPEARELDIQIQKQEQILKNVANSRSMQPLQTQIAEIRNRDTNVQNVIENSGSDGIMEINKQTSEFEQNGEYGSSIRFDQILTDGSHMENGVLKPNVTYRSGEFGYLYHTNSDGVVDQVFVADLYMKEHNGRLPYNSATLDKQAGDHAGHLIADSFGGSPKLDNLVSQYSKVNQGDYRKMELLWYRAIKAGNQVSISINLDYTNGSKRPEGFHISYMIDGELHYQYISNTRREK